MCYLSHSNYISSTLITKYNNVGCQCDFWESHYKKLNVNYLIILPLLYSINNQALNKSSRVFKIVIYGNIYSKTLKEFFNSLKKIWWNIDQSISGYNVAPVNTKTGRHHKIQLLKGGSTIQVIDYSEVFLGCVRIFLWSNVKLYIRKIYKF